MAELVSKTLRLFETVCAEPPDYLSVASVQLCPKPPYNLSKASVQLVLSHISSSFYIFLFDIYIRFSLFTLILQAE